MRAALAMLLALAATSTVAPAPVAAEPAGLSALDPGAFNPELIISDQLFFDGAAMSAADIQAFLDQKVGSCLTNRCLNIASVPVPNRPADYSIDTGGLICSAISGGNLRVSELIYRAQVACGISAKAILVTLQKEQSLVTSKAPSDWALRAAMGMGCPDTAPCDDAFAGLASQIVSGTRQLKAYKVGGFAKRPGVQYIQYHPDASCLGTTLNVRNWATASLYSYTPYQPNSSALANLYGSGDSCSSYGNRNFWRFYNEWFGASVVYDPMGDIATAYAALGGASGSLGAVTSAPSCSGVSITCTAVYAHGVIHWTRYAGAIGVAGAVGDYYLSAGGVTGRLGAPVAAASAVTDPNGNGVVQSFVNGVVHSSAVGMFTVPGAIMGAYGAVGWIRGSYGWPTAELKCGAGGCVQYFQGGAASMSRDGNIGGFLSSDLFELYQGLGGASGALGYPTGSPTAIADRNGNGTVLGFDGGVVHSSSSGVFVVPTAMMAVYSKEGWLRGYLGWPRAAAVCDPSGCTQKFAGGTLAVSPTGQQQEYVPEIAEVHAAEGGVSGYLGAATAAISKVVDAKGDGYAQSFAGGVIHSSSQGTYAVPATVMAAYTKEGWLRGYLGWPTGRAICDASGCTQAFMGGTLRVDAGGSGGVVDPAINAAYQAAGGPTGPLGAVSSTATRIADPKGNGAAQSFAGGVIHSGPSGAFPVYTTVMNAYSREGWLRGYLGWPTALQTEVTDPRGNGFAQSFQGGVIHSSASGTFGVPTTVMAGYAASGWVRGELGWPTAAATNVTAPNGNGIAQSFQGGIIHAGPAGAFAVPTKVMTVYSARGWVRGSLGWPTGVATCDATGCVQQFQGGRIDTR
jgi:uncharacterized protein with LGFP repeats